MADQAKHEKTTDEIFDIEQEGPVGDLLKEIFSSLDITIDRKNTAITDLEAVKSDVATNNAKVGITTAQASAITSNATAISSNTTAITKANNTLKVGQFSEVVTSQSAKGITANVSLYINIATISTLQFNVRLSNGVRYVGSTRLTAVKS